MEGWEDPGTGLEPCEEPPDPEAEGPDLADIVEQVEQERADKLKSGSARSVATGADRKESQRRLRKWQSGQEFEARTRLSSMEGPPSR